ncbi:MAG: hypothetical protein WC449_05630 [Candidatus Paceibacterota bacterium]
MTIIVSSTTATTTTTTTALDIITGALRLLQVASDDVVISDSEFSDSLESLNMMIDAWSNESMMLHHVTTESFPLVHGQQSYTIGTGGNFNTSRPISIEQAYIRVNGSDYPIKSVAYDDWAAIRLKSISTTFPEYFYLDQTYPLGTLNLYPIPSTADSIYLYCRKPFAGFTNLTDVVSLPPGYNRAMKFQLACELAPEYQTTAGDDVKTIAMAAKAGIKRANKRPITAQVDPGLFANTGRRYNIYSNR